MTLLRSDQVEDCARDAESTLPHILILTHELDRFEEITYLLREIAAFWRREGWRVTVQRGLGPFIPADVAILHVDLTRTPGEYATMLKKYPVVINGQVLDISKRRVSRNAVTRRDDYQGAVMVKTDCNYGGKAEAILARKRGGLGKLIFKLRQFLPWSCRTDFLDYRIFSSVRAVPWLVWLNRDLVVERFLAERSGDFYCLRTWVFLGERETNSISYSLVPVVKAANIVRREVVGEIPEELRQMRRNLRFDFGKFDYAIVDGRVVLYDANRTPNIGDVSEQFWEQIDMLSGGIKSFLKTGKSQAT